MAFSTDTKAAAKRPKQKMFRRMFIKRRISDTGLPESDWFEVTEDVKKWGSIKQQADAQRPFKFKFGGMKIVMANDKGRYNPEDDESSLWFTFGSQQRSLVRIEVGFQEIESTNGVKEIREFPANAYWDVVNYDVANWDGESAIFTGIISGDMGGGDSNEVTLQVAPLTKLLRDYSAANMSGYTNSLSASEFVANIRDHTVGGSLIFRPFFNDTTSGFNIATTTSEYQTMDSGGASVVRDSTVWDIVEKLAEAENFLPYVSGNGNFNFVSRTSDTTAAQYEFYGRGFHNGEYGHTIKQVKRFGQKISRFYSRVRLKFKEEDTTTSYYIKEATLTVSGASATWLYGERTLNISNTFIQTTATAQTLGDVIFSDVSALKREIEFSTSFIPDIDIRDIIQISYDSSTKAKPENLWDLNTWATSTGEGVAGDLVWDASVGDALKLTSEEFRILSLEFDLDKFETRIHARET